MARDIKQLHPEVQVLAQKLVEECKKQGLIIKITDCFRSRKEQDDLYAQGRTKPGKIVTNAKFGQSFHNLGLAFDFCRNDGKGAYYDNDGFFAKVGKIGKSLGLSWGGDWKGLVDKPHFEYLKFGSLNDILKKYGTPENFIKSWSNTGVKYMKVKRNYKFNGTNKECTVINDNGENYIKVKDVADLLKMQVKYEPNSKTTEFTK